MDEFTTILCNGMQFHFSKKSLADEFCQQIWSMVYKADVICVNDVLRLAKRPTIGFGTGRIGGYKYGYSRRELRKLKPTKTPELGGYSVFLKSPGRMVQDGNGYWTTEPAEKGKVITDGEHFDHAGLCEPAVRRELAAESGEDA